MPENTFIEFLAQYGIWLFPWLFGINLGLSFIGAAMAKRRGYSYGGFLCLGIFTSFLINLIVAACLKPKEGCFLKTRGYVQYTSPSAGFLLCGKCGAGCAKDMAFCPKCGSGLYNKCSGCGYECSSGMAFCP